MQNSRKQFLEIMKNTRLKQKFEGTKYFVKPLYKRIKNNRIKSNKIDLLVDVNSTIKLDSNENNVKKCYIHKCHNSNHELNKTNKCEINKCPNTKINPRNMNKEESDLVNVIDGAGNSRGGEEQKSNANNYKIRTDTKKAIIDKVPDTWLRIYPASSTPDEKVWSIIFRCVVCQLGLAALLILWTISWIFIINSFEGPYEAEVSMKFEQEQTQLVIDLATELRQITPVSSKWRDAIEKRIEDERYLTITAIERGARIKPGRFWDIPGTCLFTVYVMTALGFGAPVPHTIGGRTSALVYAVLAVPTHIYLMMNAGTCVVVHMESFVYNLKTTRKIKLVLIPQDCRNDIPSSSGNSPFKTTNSCSKKIIRILRIILAGRGVPLVAILYYVFGTIIFGLLREKHPIEVIMFPLEFTTTGGLELVNGYVRILYAFYVEGAMSLLACALAVLRRRSGAAVISMTEKYRLFAVEK